MSFTLDTPSVTPPPESPPDRPAPLLMIERRLRQQFADVAAERIRSCVDEASAALAGARIRQFLPILIERQAAEALRRQRSR